MRFSFGFLRNLLSGGSGRPALGAADTLFWGVVSVGTFLAVLLAADGYLFYIVYLREVVPSTTVDRPLALRVEEIDDATRLLNERERNFEFILNPNE